MKVTFLIALVASLSFSTVKAEGPLPSHQYLRNVFGYSWCQLSYRFETYSIAAYKTFTGNGSRPVVFDTPCWDLGKKEGQKLKEKYTLSAFCSSAIAEGKERGLNGDLLSVDSPSDCYYLGKNYGLSILSSKAREGKSSVVGSECVREYQKGKADKKANRVATPPSGMKLNYCYDTGYFDGELFD